MDEQKVPSDECQNQKRRRLNPMSSSGLMEVDPNLSGLVHSNGASPNGEDLSTRETNSDEINCEVFWGGMNEGPMRKELDKLLTECGPPRSKAESLKDKRVIPGKNKDDEKEDGEILEDNTAHLKAPNGVETSGSSKGGNVKEHAGQGENTKGERHCAIEDVDEDVDEDEEEGSRIFNEELAEFEVDDNFFTREPFTTMEFEMVEKAIKSNMEMSVAKLEKEGCGAFRNRHPKTQPRIKAVKSEQKLTEQAIEDAKVLGAPREYQQRLFEIACKQNTIIHLGTGAGKTLIALMTIRHFASAYEDGKQTLFLVPSVALAIQQSTVLRANLPYRVQVACYSTSTTAKARKALKDCEIIVATHGAINDLLMHYGDIFKMEKFNLLCIDECHYAIGSHSYATMMKRFFHTLPPESRPRVLGLTASPLVKVKATHSNNNLATMLDSLESILSATIVSDLSGVSTTSIANAQPSQQAEEKDIIFSCHVPTKKLPLPEDFKVHQQRKRELAQLDQLYEDLGPLAMSIYCRTLANEVSRNNFERESREQFASLVNYLHEVARMCDDLCQRCPHGGRSDKLLALEALLEDVIEENGSNDTVVLIFVERRITAMALNNFFRFRQKALRQGDWVRASVARTLKPKLCSKENTPRESPILVQAPLARCGSSDSPCSSPESALCNDSMDQFADAEDDVEFEAMATTVSVEHKQGNQFDDASDDENHHEMEQYFAGIRRDLHSQKEIPHGFGSDKIDCGRSVREEEDVDVGVMNQSAREPLPDQFKDDESARSTSSEVQGPADKETIRCQALVRKSTQIFKSLNLSRRGTTKDAEIEKEWLHQEKKIREVLDCLRRGDINVLIATSVVEEGVDVQACSCVVAFDSLRSAKGYVQMRGRARAKDAKFFVFKDTREKATSLSLDSAQEIEKRVQSFISSRASRAVVEYSKPAEPPAACKSDCEEVRAVEAGQYSAAAGTVDLHHAKSLVNRYVLSLPIDPAARASKKALQAFLPVYSSNELYLPSHLPSKVRRVRLPEEYCNLERKKKEKALALMAVVRLHCYGLLSDRNDLQELLRKKATQEPPQISLKGLGPFANESIGRKIFVYPLIQQNCGIDYMHKALKSRGHSLAILTVSPLPAIPATHFRNKTFGSVACSLGKEFQVHCNEQEFDVIFQFFKLLMDMRWRRRTKNFFFRMKPFQELSSLIPPYFVACLSTERQLDYKEMMKLLSESERSEAERFEAVRSTSDLDDLPQPRLLSPLYDRNFTYVTYGPSGVFCCSKFPDDKERDNGKTIDTYKDYFRLRKNQVVQDDWPLFSAHRLWHLPFSKKDTGEGEKERCKLKRPNQSVHNRKHAVFEDLRSLLLPKNACVEVPMADPNFLLLATHLPMFLNHMQVHLTVHSFREHCRIHLPHLAKCLEDLTVERIAEALTAKSCAEDVSYEKLEWIGDGVLKLIQTDSLIYSTLFSQWIEFLHEGDLSNLRSVMGCNDRLAVTCKRLKIDQFLLTAPLGRGQWSPASLELYSPNEQGLDTGEGAAVTENIPGKARADVIESILGLVYLECGYENATLVAEEMQLSLPQMEDRSNALPDRQLEPKSRLLAAATRFTGYEFFKRKDLIQEAMTHPTAMHPQTPSYQRLEWIGDAVLCLSAREWIYKTFPKFDVGQMVSLEAALVSNETLAFLAIKRRLLAHVDHSDQSLPARIEHVQWSTAHLGRGLWGTDPPKVAADVVEALIGAVYLDGGLASGMSAVANILSVLYDCLKKMYAKDYTIDTRHPRKVMQELGGSLLELDITREEDFASRKPKARVWLGRRWGAPRLDSQNFVASVECLGVDLVCISDASSEVAGNRAAAMAVAMLKRNPKLLEKLQNARGIVESSKHSRSEERATSPSSLSLPESDADTFGGNDEMDDGIADPCLD